MLACTPWGDKVWRHSWISREAADCSARPQRLPSLFLRCLALPNYVSERFCFDANHLCEELENKPEKDTPARSLSLAGHDATADGPLGSVPQPDAMLMP